jgi:ubiquinone/menaquinone biosynthesis C-methylase UbiE
MKKKIYSKWETLIKNGFFDDYTYEAKRRYTKAFSWLKGIPKNAVILEIGCGTGRYHKLLKENEFINVISSDITMEHIIRAKENNTNGIFNIASAEKLPYKSNSIDVVVSNAAIEHFDKPEVGVREISRVLKPGGKAVITSDCYSWRILQIIRLYRSRMPIDKAMTFFKFRKMFSDNDLTLEKYEGWGVTHYFRRLEKIIPFLKRFRILSEDDLSWANTSSSNDLINIIRTYILDENLFVVRKAGEQIKKNDHTSQFDLNDFIACPKCLGNIVLQSDKSYSCQACGKKYPIENDIPVLI